MDPQLLNYILAQLEKNIPEPDIRKALITSGWPKPMIEKAFETIYASPALNQPISSDSGVGFTIRRLRPPRQLLLDSFNAFRNYVSHFGIILLISLIPGVIIALITILQTRNSISAPVFTTITIIAMILNGGISVWSIVATLMLLKNRRLQPSIPQTLLSPMSKLLPYLWVLFLIFILTLGGLMLFIVPGILFTIWFMMAPVVAVAEDEGGIDALLISREYARKHFIDILVRSLFVSFFLFCITIAMLLFSYLIGMLFHLSDDPAMIMSILIAIIGPVTTIVYLIYINFLYEDLKSVHGELQYRPHMGTKMLLIISGILGFICAVAIPIFIGTQILNNGFSFNFGKKPPTQIELNAQSRADVAHLRSVLEVYYAENQRYPSALADLIPTFVDNIEIDPATNDIYAYTVEQGAQNYKLCATISGKKLCADANTDLPKK